ncbi:HAD family hydrolase [Enterococcus canis]|uniref:HAD family hydrolase n=1 Tax=Enterococcus canis TaxID=214095 RepID=UPI0008322351|nr:HAD family phosphatase [Enterococcus canis]
MIVVFDFNGTLYQDTPYHEQAWREFAKDLLGRELTDEEFREIHGRTNAVILARLLNRPLSSEEAERLSVEKEKVYQKIVAQKGKPQLTKGATAFFDYLKEQGIPFTIATASGKFNVDFYFELFELARWFDYEQVVYGDGTLPGKPAPDLFLEAARRLGGNPNEMVIFEDSHLGLEAAKNANPAKIIAIETAGNRRELAASGLPDLIITDFTDPRLFN